MIFIGMKCCTCKQEKDESLFAYRSKEKGTRCAECKECHGEYVKQHYKQNRKTYIIRSKRGSKLRMVESQRKICEYLLIHQCVDCGEKDIRVLDFDHEDPTQKEDAVYTMVVRGFSWDKIKMEIEKCSVRCAKCHRIRTGIQCQSYRQKFFENLQGQAMGC
jgi:hypothetical protein